MLPNDSLGVMSPNALFIISFGIKVLFFISDISQLLKKDTSSRMENLLTQEHLLQSVSSKEEVIKICIDLFNENFDGLIHIMTLVKRENDIEEFKYDICKDDRIHKVPGMISFLYKHFVFYKRNEKFL